MADILQIATTTISWEEAMRRGALPNCENAFHDLIRNIQLAQEMDSLEDIHDMFLEGMEGPDEHLVWQICIPS